MEFFDIVYAGRSMLDLELTCDDKRFAEQCREVCIMACYVVMVWETAL